MTHSRLMLLLTPAALAAGLALSGLWSAGPALAEDAAPAADKPADPADPADNGLSVATTPPVVIETSPKAGDTRVRPGVTTISVTFSKPMMDKAWSWSSAAKDSTPAFEGAPAYTKSGRTCKVRVKLEPDTTYGFWINSQNFGNFRDTDGRSAVPYLWVFKTAAK